MTSYPPPEHPIRIMASNPAEYRGSRRDRNQAGLMLLLHGLTLALVLIGLLMQVAAEMRYQRMRREIDETLPKVLRDIEKY